MVITLYGASGNMGIPALEKILELDFVEKVILLLHRKKSSDKLLKHFKKQLNRIECIYGNISDIETVRKTLVGSDFVINMAAVIPPLADKRPELAIEANEVGPKIIRQAIEEIKENQPKVIHISSMAVYGHRNYKHIFTEVGDPLTISPFDLYALTKMRGEFTFLESDIDNWTVIRQTAVLYDDLMKKNISDGLMFHTCFNSSLEWVTARDSARLLQNIIIKDHNHELDTNNFWRKCFNLSGPECNRITGYETLEKGFSIIGGKTNRFFKTNYNALRNFHCGYFKDGDRLENLFHYHHDTIDDFWKSVGHKHPLFKLGRIVPPVIIRKTVIDPLLKDSNAPYYWYNHNDIPRLTAYFGSKQAFETITPNWKDFNLYIRDKGDDGEDIDYQHILHNPVELNHYYDFKKEDKDIDINDLISVAEAHGGKLLETKFNKGDIYKKVKWMDQDGNEFIMRPYSVLRCGHWHNPSYDKYVWDFDRLAKKDKIYASIWYDSHKEEENHFYYLDENFNAKLGGQ